MVELEKIKECILSDTPDWVKSARRYSRKLDVHINGNDVAGYLNQVDFYENEIQYSLRKRFATSNKFVFENLLRPVDKVFNADGGSTIVKAKTDASQEVINGAISNFHGGYSVRKFISSIQSSKYYSDPSGIVFFEWNEKETYPTFKSIHSIRNYEADGRKIKWVLFEPFQIEGKEGDFYRFVDDSFDYLFWVKDKHITQIEEETYVNPFGRVPAFTNSDILNPELTYHISPVDSVVELADHYLHTTSIKNIYEFLHGYPIFWAYVQKCNVCDGTGLYDNSTCHACGGDGHTFKKDVSDIIKLKPPETADQPQLAPDVAGYVQPDLETWGEQRVELDWIWGLMHYSMWGTSRQETANNETATAAFLDVQPVSDRLNKFADAYEQTETMIIDLLGKFYIRDNYEGASVNYGRRFLMESPDAVWQKYEKARAAQAPKASLDYLLIQFYQSEFKNDIENLVKYKKSVILEPFVHKTDDEINSLPVLQEDKIRKFYFSEWWKTLSDDDIIIQSIESLTKKFDDYLKEKQNAKEVQ